jgi:hypothetical protein
MRGLGDFLAPYAAQPFALGPQASGLGMMAGGMDPMAAAAAPAGARPSLTPPFAPPAQAPAPTGLGSLFSGGGLSQGLQAASPMLLAMGQQMLTPPHQRDPNAMQRAALMMQQQAQQRGAKQKLADYLAKANLPEQQRALLENMDPEAAMKLIGEQMFKEPQGPRTEIAKIRADLDAGFITPEQAQARISMLTTRAPAASTTVNIAAPQKTLRDVYGNPGTGYIWQRGEGPGGTGEFGEALDENGRPMMVAVSGSAATTVPGEVAGRVGLAEDSLTQLPRIIEAAEQGDLTGPINYVRGLIGRGDQGELRRELMAGSEAITRMLTGAGMNAEEAQREAQLYLPTIVDNAESLVSKARQLQRRLIAINEVAMRGRGELPARRTVPEVPDFSKMSDAELDAYIEEQRRALEVQ